MFKLKSWEELVRGNIESLIMVTLSQDEDKLSMDKIKDYIQDTFDYVVDDNFVEQILNTIPVVKDISKDGIVTLHTNINDDEDDEMDEDFLDQEIHDNAIDQAQDNLKLESVADALTTLKTGMKYDSNLIQLDESNLFYPLHQSAVKNKSKYIISTIVGSKELSESVVRCKIDGTSLFLEIPIKNFVK